jgi:hypothetical protein
MAIRPNVLYPSQTYAPGAGYPYGRARNESNPGDRDGYPLEEQWVQDLQGFLQAILAQSGTVPNDIPDSASASQYMSGLRELLATRNEFAALNAAYYTAFSLRVPTFSGRLVDRFASAGFDWRQDNVDNNGAVYCQLLGLTNNMRILSIGCTVSHDGGHVGLPTSMPTLGLFYRAADSDTLTQVSTWQSDTSATVGAYEARHSILLNLGGGHLVDASREYFVAFRGETGANSETGLRFRAANAAVIRIV